MRHTKNIFFGIILLLYFPIQNVKGQNSNCNFYQSILDTLSRCYVEKTQFSIKRKKCCIKFDIVKDILPYSFKEREPLIIRVLKDSSVIKDSFRLNNRAIDSIQVCGLLGYQVDYVDFEEMFKGYVRYEPGFAALSKEAKKNSCYYTQDRVNFSEVLFYKEDYALAFIRLDITGGGSNKFFLHFLFREINNRWVISQIETRLNK